MNGKSLAKDRAWELDFLRGFAVLFMLFMHTSWDLRYEFGLPVCSYLAKGWFWTFFQPTVILFVGVSGICCTFSKSNVKRGLKLLAATLALDIGTYIVTRFFGIDCLIIFNVLALLTCGIFIYVLVSFIEKKTNVNPNVINVILGLAGSYICIVGSNIHYMDNAVDSLIFIPLGFDMPSVPSMADYMPIFPWLGVFLVGCVIGRLCYKDKKTLLPNRGKVISAISRPVEFIGRHSLIIYLTHQPVIYALLYVIFVVIRAK
ncbi:MAG: DUF1624 domain-containing protein [Clostridiales bacterium]|nr:DUF1624 domain-containing protein [Clostridiales bacterium]